MLRKASLLRRRTSHLPAPAAAAAAVLLGIIIILYVLLAAQGVCICSELFLNALKLTMQNRQKQQTIREKCSETARHHLPADNPRSLYVA